MWSGELGWVWIDWKTKTKIFPNPISPLPTHTKREQHYWFEIGDILMGFTKWLHIKMSNIFSFFFFFDYFFQ